MPHQIGDHLLMGRSEAVLPVVAVTKTEQLLAVVLPTARLLPEFRRQHHRADTPPAHRPGSSPPGRSVPPCGSPVAEGQIGIDSPSQLPDHSGPEHQLMAYHFRIGRDLSSGRQEHLRITHEPPWSLVIGDGSSITGHLPYLFHEHRYEFLLPDLSDDLSLF